MSPPLSPQSNWSPPFTALRAVEAAVRHRSYTAAARELSVTHAAISQSIKRLEQELALKLFERRGQFMEPSEVAQRMASAYSEATATLNRSLGGLFRPAQAQAAILAMPADFGRLWFAPRLDRVAADLPGLQVEIRTAAAVTAEAPDADVLIGYESLSMPGWSSEAVAPITLFPVCSPAFRATHRLARPNDLIGLPLLAERRWPWEDWFAGVGEGKRRLSHSLAFDDANMTLDAAARGHGVALTHIFHAEEQLRAGTLVVPMPQRVETSAQLWLGAREGTDARVRDWTRRELHLCLASASQLTAVN